MIRAFCTWLALAAGVLAGPASGACLPDTLDLRSGDSVVRYTVEVVDTPEERAQGLMFRESLGAFAGMLFVYEAPAQVAFWMKNTLIPLDMIFADETGTVRRVHANAIPGDLTPIPGGNDIRFVLEVNGGTAAMLGIGPGSVMRHPAIPQEIAAWPCDEK